MNTHTHTHTSIYQSESQILFGILALQPPPRPSWLDVACSTHSRFRLGQSTAVGSAASSVLDASLRARGRRAASARHYARPGRPRPPARARACTRGSAGRNRPPHTPWRRPGAGAGSHAQQPNNGTATRKRRAAADAQFLQARAVAERLRQRLDLRGADAPAVHHGCVWTRPSRERCNRTARPQASGAQR